MKWSLLDCAEQHLKFPDTFQVPTSADLALVQAGDHVKLIFQLDEPVMGVESERMWVEVVSKVGARCMGTLVNDPMLLGKDLKFGDTVFFSERHIAVIDRSEHE